MGLQDTQKPSGTSPKLDTVTSAATITATEVHAVMFRAVSAEAESDLRLKRVYSEGKTLIFCNIIVFEGVVKYHAYDPEAQNFAELS